jgi:hypothetical protein
MVEMIAHASQKTTFGFVRRNLSAYGCDTASLPAGDAALQHFYATVQHLEQKIHWSGPSPLKPGAVPV